MDYLLLVIGFLCMVVGILGSVLPILPGPIMSWIGLFLLYFTKTVPHNNWILGFTLVATIVITILDYTIPAKGTKRFGGSRYGVWGTNIGLIIGLFFPPIGFIVGLFVGAFVGEICFNPKDKNRALKAAFGAFLGFLTSGFIKLVLGVAYLILFVIIACQYFL